MARVNPARTRLDIVFKETLDEIRNASKYDDMTGELLVDDKAKEQFLNDIIRELNISLSLVTR